MTDIAIEQARFRRPDGGSAALVARSPGFSDDWMADAERLILGFGGRPAGQACPAAVFAQPLGFLHVAVVQAADQPGPALGFRFLVIERAGYQQFLGDPFALALRFPADWAQHGPLPALACPRVLPSPRTVQQVQQVLQRVKASALREGEDPDDPAFERTAENSESPALLGGVQVLVDGGKLVFERRQPDPALLEALWTLLPHSTRASLWPASFAFANTLRFDALVVPNARPDDFNGYTSEEQAAEYPAGRYELALQTAVEEGDQNGLDALLNRRSGAETIRLGLILLVVVSLLALIPRVLDRFLPAHDPAIHHKAAAAAGMVSAGDPWTAIALKLYGDAAWAGKR